VSALAPGVARARALPAPLRWLGRALFVLAVPTVLITTNVLQVTADRDFYEREFAKYEVARVTGLSADQLRAVAQAFIDYFYRPPGRLDVEVELNGSRRALFNEREIAHMEDVQHLMHLVRWLQIGSGTTAIVGAVVLLARGRPGVRGLGALGLVAGGATLVVLLLLGVLSMLHFGEAFVQFHHLAFSNDLWMLDPRRDYLIMLFPEGFWFDATMRIAMLTAIEACAFIGLGTAALIWGRRV
jgi:integral membrane protein (TIGR01906 family)